MGHICDKHERKHSYYNEKDVDLFKVAKMVQYSFFKNYDMSHK